MIEVRDLMTGYARPRGKNAVLAAVSCEVPARRITVLVGPNGSGKSTLLRAMCGLLPAWSGTVRLDGVPVSAYTPAQRARKVAFLAQQRTVPDCTVERLVLHGRFPYTRFPRQYRADDLAAMREALRALDITGLAEQNLRALSGGQQQKAYLAMALAQQTPVVVLDEPLTFLDIRQQLDLMETLRGLKAQGKTIVLVVHDLPAALRLADRLIVLSAGRVVAQGNPAVIAGEGTIDRVFSVRTRRIDGADGAPLYTFCADDACPRGELV